MRRTFWVTILCFPFMVGLSCQKEVAKPEMPVVMQGTKGDARQKSSILEAAAIEETIKELQQQGLIK